jgi:hypothetical protein
MCCLLTVVFRLHDGRLGASTTWPVKADWYIGRPRHVAAAVVLSASLFLFFPPRFLGLSSRPKHEVSLGFDNTMVSIIFSSLL